jgi:phosphatidylserine synthase
MPAVLVLLGLLMVSRVPFPHAMHTLLKKRHSMPFLAGLVVMIIVAAVEWQFALLAVTLGYLVTGLGIGLFRVIMRRDGGDGDDGDDDGDEAFQGPQPSRN